MKRKNCPTEDDTLTASESVKTRPRKKSALPVAPNSCLRPKNRTGPQKSHIKSLTTNPNQSHTTCRVVQPKQEYSDHPDDLLQRLSPAHLTELSDIWNADKRMPTPESRRSWAIARRLKPEMVHRWWYRRKQLAKKAGIKLPKETYDLPVGTPPVIEMSVEKEELGHDDDDSKTKLLQTGVNREKVDDDRLEHSSPATTLRDMKNLDSDCPTLCSSSPPEEYQHKRRAYTYSVTSARSSLPPSSPPSSLPSACSPSSCPNFPLFLPIFVSKTPIESENEDAPSLWCNQNDAEETSDYTCCLCAASYQLDPSPTQPSALFVPSTDSNAVERQSQSSNLEHISLPLTLDALLLMRISAIPFLSQSADLSTTIQESITRNYCCNHQICLGGNTYTHDGSFVGRCSRVSIPGTEDGDGEIMQFVVRGVYVGGPDSELGLIEAMDNLLLTPGL